MKNLEKFKHESLGINQLISLKGGERNGGDGSCGHSSETTQPGCVNEDYKWHYTNDDGTYDGFAWSKYA